MTSIYFMATLCFCWCLSVEYLSESLLSSSIKGITTTWFRRSTSQSNGVTPTFDFHYSKSKGKTKPKPPQCSAGVHSIMPLKILIIWHSWNILQRWPYCAMELKLDLLDRTHCAHLLIQSEYLGGSFLWRGHVLLHIQILMKKVSICGPKTLNEGFFCSFKIRTSSLKSIFIDTFQLSMILTENSWTQQTPRFCGMLFGIRANSMVREPLSQAASVFGIKYEPRVTKVGGHVMATLFRRLHSSY